METKRVSLLEKYAPRLQVSEAVYAKAHDGEKMDNHRKVVIARVLENTNNFLREAFENSTGTQKSALGDWKKFTLNLTDVILPNLITNDLVIVQPMTSTTGSVVYLNYVAGTNKGGVEQNDLFNGVYEMGKMTSDRQRYTSDRVVEAFDSFVSGTTKVAWHPVMAGSIRALDANGNEVSDNKTTAWTADENGVITAGAYVTGKSAADVKKIAYVYNNIDIPQNDLPILNAKLDRIALVAKARRIAIYYSQIANFQAKTDYGFDLGDGLAEQAKAELMYEIDSEVVQLLSDAAALNDELIWSRTLPVGVSKLEHYAGFAELIEKAKVEVYKRTQKFQPNWMLISADCLPVLSFIPGWKADNNAHIAGPYKAGTFNGLGVYVSPIMAAGEYVLGVNGGDLQTGAAIYAPYMALVPTQLLGFADGAMSQGLTNSTIKIAC